MGKRKEQRAEVFGGYRKEDKRGTKVSLHQTLPFIILPGFLLSSFLLLFFVWSGKVRVK
jgi:hypothetical protein